MPIDAKEGAGGLRASLVQWLPLGVFTWLAYVNGGDLPPWGKMWLLAVAIFAGFKWATWYRARRQEIQTTGLRSLAYLFLWPGMDARVFLSLNRQAKRPTGRAWRWSAMKVGIGVVLIWGCARWAGDGLVAGWTGMVGLMFLLHFGLMEMLAFFWQDRGICAQPLMNAPFRAASLREFWGRRWNSGFRIIAFDLMFQPLTRWTSLGAAMMGTFLISGLIHDLVISVPIGGGYGGPTAFFLIQGAGILVERSKAGRRILRPHGLVGHVFTLSLLILPVGWLFPPLWVERVMLPFLHAIKAL